MGGGGGGGRSPPFNESKQHRNAEGKTGGGAAAAAAPAHRLLGALPGLDGMTGRNAAPRAIPRGAGAAAGPSGGGERGILAGIQRAKRSTPDRDRSGGGSGGRSGGGSGERRKHRKHHRKHRRKKKEKQQGAGGAFSPDKAGAAPADAPRAYVCAFSGRLMSRPVKTPYGHTLDHDAVLAWQKRHGRKCPLTGQPLASRPSMSSMPPWITPAANPETGSSGAATWTPSPAPRPYATRSRPS